jgi:hypothetical protein
MPGGVCAVLDYEVDMMAEYVAEMATRVVTPEAAVTSPFRKFVSQILTSTRLPHTTILLGLNYLAKRVNTLKTQGPYKATEGQVWRYLTVSLLLGSKFLDDNTFQNRSWSEVSGIAVAELNSLEFEWVNAMGWRLYVNLDHSKDYQAWLENWNEWQHQKKRRVAQASRERMASLVPAIDTDMSMYHHNNSPLSPVSRYPQKQQAVDYERHHAMKLQQGYRSRDSTWGHNPWSAPLTPPDSGYELPSTPCRLLRPLAATVTGSAKVLLSTTLPTTRVRPRVRAMATTPFFPPATAATPTTTRIPTALGSTASLNAAAPAVSDR